MDTTIEILTERTIQDAADENESKSYFRLDVSQFATNKEFLI